MINVDMPQDLLHVLDAPSGFLELFDYFKAATIGLPALLAHIDLWPFKFIRSIHPRSLRAEPDQDYVFVIAPVRHTRFIARHTHFGFL
ncbi:hypothetical protein [Shewanella sp. Iso12]|uniref:hypothetical protein n=1 Tax=Shewanella sp. Iso12 TaxID=1826753 RepID=UPI0014313803|nr:hypothetical protein [Shewanella sp. Iso12]NJI86910.1 hypothetical protein [Shewanella sp. Iso12]